MKDHQWGIKRVFKWCSQLIHTLNWKNKANNLAMGRFSHSIVVVEYRLVVKQVSVWIRYTMPNTSCLRNLPRSKLTNHKTLTSKPWLQFVLWNWSVCLPNLMLKILYKHSNYPKCRGKMFLGINLSKSMSTWPPTRFDVIVLFWN